MNSITSNYEKATSSTKKQINMGGENLIRDKEIIKRIETNEENNSFVTIKIPKENFDNHSTDRLIHPAEKVLGGISKLILDKINKKINQKFELNQCKNTNIVIDWFEQVKSLNLYRFENFDIKEFHPSIKNLLKSLY